MVGCRSAVVLAGLLALSLASCNQPKPAPPIVIGLSTSLPIYWAESDDPADMLAPGGEAPWPRRLIEQRHRLVPLDAMDAAGALARTDVVLLAQPRPLTPAENVALDQWVRAGGIALVFADPALTAESRFPLGDKRRPQDVALLSPILLRWGLRLMFDDSQDPAQRTVFDPVVEGIPVRLAGHLRLADGAGEPGDRCELGPEALVARCRIGSGKAIVVADADLLDTAEDASRGERERVLERLIESLAKAVAAQTGDKRGQPLSMGDSPSNDMRSQGRKGMING